VPKSKPPDRLHPFRRRTLICFARYRFDSKNHYPKNGSVTARLYPRANFEILICSSGWESLAPGIVAQAVLAISIVAAVGLALGSLGFRGIRLGTAGVLFVGIFFGPARAPASFPTRSRHQHVYKTLRTVEDFFRTRSTLITTSQKPSKGAPAGLLQPADRH
jgi:hypothetical protein